MSEPNDTWTKSAQEAAPERYIRIAHTRTAKDGWRHETTISLRWTGDDPDEEWALTELLETADRVGRDESARRTALDAGAGE